MRILVIGTKNSTHIMSFVDELTQLNYQVILLDHRSTRSKKSVYDFYSERHVTVIEPVTVKEIPVGVIEYVECIRKSGDFEICHIQYLTNEICLAVALCENQFQCIIANYWGSDLLRASAKDLEVQRFLLDRAACIVGDAEVIEDRLNEYFESRYHDIIKKVRFKSYIIEELLKNKPEKADIQEKQITVVCGYNGNPKQQHLLMIEAIKACDISVQEKLKVIVPMTYGGATDYQKRIEEQLEGQAFESEILVEYMTIKENAQLRMHTDIFIHMQVSDAFSFSVVENLLCNNIIINAEWLDYQELQQYNMKCYEVKDAEELSSQLEDIVLHLDRYRKEVAANRGAAERYVADGSKRRWQSIYEECLTVCKGIKETGNRNTLWEYCLNYTEYKLKRNLAESVCRNLFQQKEHNIICKLEDKKARKVVIYGMGKWGNLFYQEILKELEKKRCKIRFFYYDKKEYSGLGLERISLEGLNEADIIIITSIHEYFSIIQNLNNYTEIERCMSMTDFL